MGKGLEWLIILVGTAWMLFVTQILFGGKGSDRIQFIIWLTLVIGIFLGGWLERSRRRGGK